VVGFAYLQAKTERPFHAKDYRVIEAGVLRADLKQVHLTRVADLYEALFGLMSERRPNVMVMERAFHGVNASTSIKLGEARGAFIAAARRCEVGVEEITPAQVKKIVAGQGRAEKTEVSLVIQQALGFDRGTLPLDATDAIAIALAFALSNPESMRGNRHATNAARSDSHTGV
jgi:crossover junction endodeoxyribonuclease RuvC